MPDISAPTLPCAPVAALHASASGPRQWAALEQSLSPRVAVLAPDLTGYGGEPGEADGLAGLDRRAMRVIRLIEQTGRAAHLVGHSFGGAIAVRIAVTRPDLVRSLTLYEPAVIGLLRNSKSAADQRAFMRFQAAGGRLLAALASVEPAAGVAPLIDFWNGDGAWARLDRQVKERLCATAGDLMQDFVDSLGEPSTPTGLRRIEMPVMVLSGARSPEFARRLAARFAAAVPTARHHEIQGVGHMAPVDAPARVNARICAHIAACAAWDGASTIAA
ncbi:MAG: alpha/beta fold hydrolase [Pseudomonadota bacterium]